MFANYELFTGYYDLSFRMMLMRQYSGRQKAYEQAVKHFIGGSKKYGPDRPTPKQKNRSSTKHGKVRKKCYQKPEPDDPGPNQRTIIAFGDAKMAWNMPGTLSMSHRKLKHYMALASKRLGRFTAADRVDPSLIGQLKFEVIEIPEYMTSQASHDQQSFDESVHSYSLSLLSAIIGRLLYLSRRCKVQSQAGCMQRQETGQRQRPRRKASRNVTETSCCQKVQTLLDNLESRR